MAAENISRSNSKQGKPHGYQMLLSTFAVECILATMACLANGVVLATYSVMKKNLRKKIPNTLFVFQALSDMIGILALIFHSIFLKARMQNDSLASETGFWKLIEFFMEWANFINIMVLALLTIDRYAAIRYPIYHHTHFTTGKLILFFCILAVISTIPAFVSSAYIIEIFDRNASVTARKAYYLTVGAITFIIITFVYYALFSVYKIIESSIQGRLKLIKEIESSDQKKRGMKIESEKKKHRRILTILFLTITTYTLTYLPMTINRICYFFLPPDVSNSLDYKIIFFSLIVLQFLPSLINSIVTIVLKEDYRDTLLRKFKQRLDIDAFTQSSTDNNTTSFLPISSL